MKRNLYLILALLLLGVVQVRAQEEFVITVEDKNGGVNELWSSSSIGACKLTFVDGQMRFHEGDAVKATFNIKDLSGLKFYTSQDIESVTAKNMVVYTEATEELMVNALPGTLVEVYHADGEKVCSQVLTVATNVISLAHLPAGLYVAVAGGETLKFVK